MGMMIHRRKEGHLHYHTKKTEQIEEGQPIVDVQEEVKDEVKDEGVVYTRDDINSLPFFSLKSIASKYGIDVKGKKAPDLRDELIKKMGI